MNFLLNALLDLTLRGSLVTLAIILGDAIFQNKLWPSSRRLWWIPVPVAFTMPFHFAIHSSLSTAAEARVKSEALFQIIPIKTDVVMASSTAGISVAALITFVWLAGVLFFFIITLTRTLHVSRYWTPRRLVTKQDILTELENCKMEAGITAPIGLLIADDIPCPAILGWLRPRLLMPKTFFASLSSLQRRHVFLHELAHFRNFDVPMNWLFTLMIIIHWFNPLAWLAMRRWKRTSEEAADETVLKIMHSRSGEEYGATLLHALKQLAVKTQIHGAFAISESAQTLKHRIHMLTKYPYQKRNFILTGIMILFMLSAALLQIGRAENTEEEIKKTALIATTQWLEEIDQGKYAESWKDAAKSFQKAITETKWVQALNSVRKPLGKCTVRKVASQMHQSEVDNGIKGDFVITQFESSFENMKYAIETVTFEKEADGTWRASGYYIKPR